MRVAFLALVLALLAGCTTSGVIDGWEVGDRVACGTDYDCDQYALTAIHRLDRLSPGHAPIVSATVHNQARIHARSGGPILVVVILLADGSTRAFGVGRAGIEPGLFVFPPSPH